MFIPFAVMLGATLALIPSWPVKNKRTAAIGEILCMAVLLEIILGMEAASGFQTVNLLMSLLIGGVTLGLLALRRRRVKRLG